MVCVWPLCKVSLFVYGLYAGYHCLCMASMQGIMVCVWPLCKVSLFVYGLYAGYHCLCMASMQGIMVCVWPVCRVSLFVYVPLCRVAPSPLPSRPASQTGSYAWSEGGSSSMHEGSSQQSGAAPSNADFNLHNPGQNLHPAPQLLTLHVLMQRHGVRAAYLLPCLTDQASHHTVVPHSISEGTCHSSKA